MIDDFMSKDRNKQKSMPYPTDDNFDQVEEVEPRESPFKPPDNYEVSEMQRSTDSASLNNDEPTIEVPAQKRRRTKQETITNF